MSSTLQDLVTQIQDSSREIDTRVLEAMSAVDRADFLPQRWRSNAYLDISLPLMANRDGQINSTCSTPSVVAYMLTQLGIEPGMRVAEMGYGCGYAAAIMIQMLETEGSFTGFEYFTTIAQMGAENITRAFPGFENIRLFQGDGFKILRNHAPYERVLCSFGVEFAPETMAEIANDVLCQGGKILYPQSYEYLILTKTDGGIHTQTMPGDGWVRQQGIN